MAKVALVRCDNYEENNVRAAVQKGLKLLGGAENFVKAGEKILLKPNLLSADPPEKCVTTHPAVFRAVVQELQEVGAVVTFGDSPAFNSTKTAAEKAGLLAVARETGVQMADFARGREVSFPEGRQNKKFTVAEPVLDADGLISLPKLKTHGFAKLTGAVKNQFGCIPGALKGEFHVKLPDINNFARMLVDLNRLIRPRLFIMDGIMAMEGNGPRGGNPVPMKVLIFSADPIALDATVCRMIKLDPELVPTIRFGLEDGLGTYLEKDLELVGDSIEHFYKESFDIHREPIKPYKPGHVIGYLRNLLVPRPVINRDKCRKCGICVRMCPVPTKPVNWPDRNKQHPPTHNYKDCIRCYCCQELCPESAITLKVPLLRKVIGKKK